MDRLCTMVLLSVIIGGILPDGKVKNSAGMVFGLSIIRMIARLIAERIP